MPRELLIPIRKFLRLLDYMGRIGLDPDAMAMALGYTRQELQAMPSAQLLPSSDYSRMYKESVRQMETLKRPIPWAAGIGSEAHELMCHCIIGCKTLGDALDMAQRFDKLTYPLIGYRMRVERTEAQFELHYQVRTESEGSVFAPEDWDRAQHYEAVARAVNVGKINLVEAVDDLADFIGRDLLGFPSERVAYAVDKLIVRVTQRVACRNFTQSSTALAAVASTSSQ